MEMDSSSLDGSRACDSGDSLDGLTFGKKIYFEDVGSGGGSGGSSSKPPATTRKGKGVAQGGGQPPRCMVEGCKVDLTGAKAYYCRHKVCGMHSKAPKVVVAGMEQRFCQQCSRFHQLAEFDQGKRSCRRRLAGHNERRRKPPPGPLSRYGRLPSPYYEDSSRNRSFLMDFTHPRPPGGTRDVWPNVNDRMAIDLWHNGLDASQGGAALHGAHTYMQCPSELPPGQCLTGVLDSSCALSLLSTQPMAQPLVSGYMNDPWAHKGHGPHSSSHEIQNGAGLGYVTDGDNCQFSGELELALQGNRQCPGLSPGRGYDHTGHGMHWSL